MIADLTMNFEELDYFFLVFIHIFYIFVTETNNSITSVV